MSVHVLAHVGWGGTVFSHDQFFLADGKEKCANVINGDDYLFRKCAFPAQQLHVYDSNLGRDVSSCRLSSPTAWRSFKVLTVGCSDRKVKPSVHCYADIYSKV